MKRLPVLVCVDVEPDEFFIEHDDPRPWRGYEAGVEYLGEVRGRLSGDDGPARFTWVFRMDHQVAEVYGRSDWAIHHYPQQLATLLAAGDDLGLHAHPYRWDARERVWIVDHGNQPWVEDCLRSAFEAFALAMGRPCTTFRFGDRWMNHETMAWLEREGVRFDLTVEPGQPALPSYHPNERFTGSLPDYARVPRAPYHPSAADYRQPDPSRVTSPWVVPMTTAAVKARWLRRAYYFLFRPWRTGVWTALLSHDPGLFARIVTAALQDPSTTHLAIPVRSDVFANPTYIRRVRENVEFLRRHPQAGRFAWTTAEGVVRSVATRGRAVD